MMGVKVHIYDGVFASQFCQIRAFKSYFMGIFWAHNLYFGCFAAVWDLQIYDDESLEVLSGENRQNFTLINPIDYFTVYRAY